MFRSLSDGNPMDVVFALKDFQLKDSRNRKEPIQLIGNNCTSIEPRAIPWMAKMNRDLMVTPNLIFSFMASHSGTNCCNTAIRLVHVRGEAHGQDATPPPRSVPETP